ncbi:Gfo/Idh/MocA family oxidoreductase [[Clostridium] innocuum]|nr:Gfo/Idh/MocA family oxidoreductase [Erysipelotrichaceae bacterium]MCR0381860.1 Gfo/Idh/MocA family oxidoreductase [[Clostridium] innocuum]MCR0414301.1 Gfo/Idh/MocA family oxidoreductase [[Clostridium] innocuum]MCR0535277.1 Gfo/Idh/MocA family oxidoreductase [[Clostridium] innocuum]MDU1120725.1 Gfo/Idh/MocA family oxidoreductase [Erysipelotrichaceae bacterium]
MNKTTIHIAVIAFGGIAKTHLLGAYMANMKLSLPFKIRVSHIVTSRPEAVPYEDIKICTSIEELKKDADSIDIIDICNINQAHLATIKEVLSMKKAIYCEKPLAEHMEAANEAVALVKQEGLLTGVPLIFRYLPCVHLLKEQLKKQTLGEIIGFEAIFYHDSYLQDAKRRTWRTKSSAGGGASIDLGIHMLDIVRFLFGEAVGTKNQCSIYFPEVYADEIAHTDLIMKKGYSGTVQVSRIYHQKKQKTQLEVFCEKGSYLCDFTQTYELEINDCLKGAYYSKADQTHAFMRYMVTQKAATQYHLDAHMACIADFARKVYDGSDSGFLADFEEALKSQALLYDR